MSYKNSAITTSSDYWKIENNFGLILRDKLISDSIIQQRHLIENCVIVWLCTKNNFHSPEYISHVQHLQSLLYIAIFFDDQDQCLDFISDIKNETVFLIISSSTDENIIELLNHMKQLECIYILCDKKDKNRLMINEKVRGIFTTFRPICDGIRRDIRQCEDDLISFTILSKKYSRTGEYFDLMDQLFLYTYLLKYHLLNGINQKTQDRNDLINLCRTIYQFNDYQSKVIDDFSQHYNANLSLKWYTRDCFISSMLKKAFRCTDVNLLLYLAFFIRDIDHEIKQKSVNLSKNFDLVYRGQGITENDLDKILKNRDGLMSFNNFFTATLDQDAALNYAHYSRTYRQLIGVLFIIGVDRSDTQFTRLGQISDYFESDSEVLFSINTIFQVKSIDLAENDLYNIHLRYMGREHKNLIYVGKFVQNETETEYLEPMSMKLANEISKIRESIERNRKT